MNFVATSEQLSLLAAATDRIAIVGPDGQIVGWATPSVSPTEVDRSLFTPEQIAEINRRRNEPGEYVTTAQLLNNLRSNETP